MNLFFINKSQLIEFYKMVCCNYCKKKGHSIYLNRILNCPKLIKKHNNNLKQLAFDAMTKLDNCCTSSGYSYQPKILQSVINTFYDALNTGSFDNSYETFYKRIFANNIMISRDEQLSDFICKFIRQYPSTLNIVVKDGKLATELYKDFFSFPEVSIHIAMLLGQIDKIESIQLETLCVERFYIQISDFQVISIMYHSDQTKLENKINDYINTNKINALRDNYEKIFSLMADSYYFENTIIKLIDNDTQWFVDNGFECTIKCVYRYYENALKKLIKINPSSTYKQNKNGETLLHCACVTFSSIENKHDYAIIKYLIPLSNCLQTDKYNKTPKEYLIQSRKDYIDNKWKNCYKENPDYYKQIIEQL